MNDYGDDDLRRDDDEDRLQWFDEARRRVQTPATIMLVFGLISVFLAVISLALDLVSPDTTHRPIYDWMADMQKNQPANQRQPMPPYEEWLKQQQIQGIASAAVSLICSFLIVLGAGKMKQLRGYGLAVTASVLSMIPCTNSCCCLATPFGIWALVVLLNSDVKLAFTRVKTEAAGGTT
jgi:hypothetical protein